MIFKKRAAKLKTYFRLLTIFLLFMNPVFSQSISKKRGKVTIKYENGNKEASGKVKNYKKQGIWKYWTESGQLEKTITYKDDNKNGLYTEYYEDGNKSIEGNYVNDLKDSEWKSWYEGNVYSSLNHYANGKKVDVQKSWYNNGQLMEQQKFENDKLVYDWKWFDNGRPNSFEYYENGLKDGTFRTYADPSENKDTLPISIDNYSNGKREGVHLHYYHGTLLEEIFYKNDQLDGSYKRWDSNGVIRISENYVRGNRDGVCIYYNHGKRIREVIYSNGKMNGTEKEFEESGLLFRISWYNDGRVDSTHNYHPNGNISISRNYKYYPGFVRTEEFSTYTEWDAEGHLLLRGAYHFEMKDKDWITYYNDGKIKSVTPYVAGKIKGVYKKYYPNGKSMIEMECDGNNVITQPKVWDEKGKSIKAGTKKYQEIVDSSKPGEIYNDPKMYKENRTAVPSDEIIEAPSDITREDRVANVDDVPQVIHLQEDKPISSTDTSIFTFVQEMPMFPNDGMQKFIKDNLKYPDAYKDTMVMVKVWVSFIVEKNGVISNVNVAKGVPSMPLFDKEAIRVISKMPKWIPGKMNGKTVRIQMVQPVKFSLQ